MYVRVTSMTTNVCHVITTSRTTLVKDLKDMVRKVFPEAPEGMRLLFGGKQVSDGLIMISFRGLKGSDHDCTFQNNGIVAVLISISESMKSYF